MRSERKFTKRISQFTTISLVMLIAACGGTSAVPTTSPLPTSTPIQTTAANPLTPPTPDQSALAEEGQRLADSLGCQGCHSIDGQENVGPTWQGLFGSTENLEGGGTAEVNETYIRKSIRQPDAEIVEGFFDLMTPFSPDDVSDEEMDAIIAFLKTLQQSND